MIKRPTAAKAPGNQWQIGEQVFDFSVRHAAHEDFLDHFFKSVTNDSGAKCGQDDLDGERLSVFPAR